MLALQHDFFQLDIALIGGQLLAAGDAGVENKPFLCMLVETAVERIILYGHSRVFSLDQGTLFLSSSSSEFGRP